jgi:hypothetical protein
VFKGDSLISNYYGYSCQISQSALQRTYFVRSYCLSLSPPNYVSSAGVLLQYYMSLPLPMPAKCSPHLSSFIILSSPFPQYYVKLQIMNFFIMQFLPPCCYILSLDCKYFLQRIGFEVLTAVIMKSTIFWDITTCSPLRVKRSFGGTYRLNFHG